MAKAKANKAPAKSATKASASTDPKYAIDDLVEATGLQPASVRVALRELGVDKEFGNKYGWSNQKDFKEVVAALKERSAKRKEKTEAADDAPKSKPAAKGKAKPAAKGKGKAAKKG